jgi:hypothetical protein
VQLQDLFFPSATSCGTANYAMPQDFFARLLQPQRGVTPCMGHGGKLPTRWSMQDEQRAKIEVPSHLAIF